MRTVYVGYPRSSSHLKLLKEICPDEENLILLPDRSISNSDCSEFNIIGFYNRLRNRREISETLKNYSIEKLVLAMPFFYKLPRGGNEVVLFEEGLSGYQKLYLEKPAISFRIKLKDLLKLILIKTIMINESNLIQQVVLGPNYSFGRKVNTSYKYFVTNINALIPDKLNLSIDKNLIFFKRKRKNDNQNRTSILFILDPLVNKSKITLDIFLHFLNEKYKNIKNLIHFQLHPADFKNSEYLKLEFRKTLKFNFEFVSINDLDKIPEDYRMEGLNSSLLYYHRIINGGKIHSYAQEYAEIDKRYSSELLRRFGNPEVSFLYE